MDIAADQHLEPDHGTAVRQREFANRHIATSAVRGKDATRGGRTDETGDAFRPDHVRLRPNSGLSQEPELAFTHGDTAAAVSDCATGLESHVAALAGYVDRDPVTIAQDDVAGGPHSQVAESDSGGTFVNQDVARGFGEVIGEGHVQCVEHCIDDGARTAPSVDLDTIAGREVDLD